MSFAALLHQIFSIGEDAAPHRTIVIMSLISELVVGHV